MKNNDSWMPEDLDLSERDTAELAGLLALAAGERTPPARLKARVLGGLRYPNASIPAAMTALEPGRRMPTGRVAAWAAAGIMATLLVVLALWPRGQATMLAEVRGSVSIDGRPAQAGQVFQPGQEIAVGRDSEAVLVIGGRVAARLLHGGEVFFHDQPTIELELRKGWLLSAVVNGTPYSVITEHGRISALGTDFMTRKQPADTFFCICHGHLKIAGAFGEFQVKSENHGGKEFTKSLAPHEPRHGTMVGHTTSDILSLRAFLKSS